MFLQGVEVFFRKGAEGIEVVGAEVVAVEVMGLKLLVLK